MRQSGAMRIRAESTGWAVAADGCPSAEGELCTENRGPSVLPMHSLVLAAGDHDRLVCPWGRYEAGMGQ